MEIDVIISKPEFVVKTGETYALKDDPTALRILVYHDARYYLVDLKEGRFCGMRMEYGSVKSILMEKYIHVPNTVVVIK